MVANDTEYHASMGEGNIQSMMYILHVCMYVYNEVPL